MYAGWGLGLGYLRPSHLRNFSGVLGNEKSKEIEKKYLADVFPYLIKICIFCGGSTSKNLRPEICSDINTQRIITEKTQFSELYYMKPLIFSFGN